MKNLIAIIALAAASTVAYAAPSNNVQEFIVAKGEVGLQLNPAYKAGASDYKGVCAETTARGENDVNNQTNIVFKGTQMNTPLFKAGRGEQGLIEIAQAPAMVLGMKTTK
jgi:hypothetical protein